MSLRFEKLDSRELLASDMGESVEEATAYVAPAPVAESGMFAVAPLPVELSVESNPDVQAVPPLDVEVPVVSPLWGDPSGGAAITTMQSSDEGYGQLYPPEISNFNGTEHLGTWTFEGEVHDDSEVEGLEVRFGGLLEGFSTTAGADGTFEFTFVFPPNTSGVVSATVTDTNGLDSLPVEYIIWG